MTDDTKTALSIGRSGGDLADGRSDGEMSPSDRRSDVAIERVDSQIVAHVDTKAFDRRAILTAAFGFVDRAFVSLRRADEQIDIVLAPKGDAPLGTALEAELADALWEARLSGALFANGRDFVERLTLRALGTPDAEIDAPSAELPPLTEEDLAAFEDPLGIAQSWEDKYLKKDPPKDSG